MNSRSAPGSDGGFTIVEVLVALTVLVTAMLGAALLFENAMLVSGNTRNRVVAANLATQQMEHVRGLAANPATFGLIPLGSTPYVYTVNGTVYTVSQTVSPVVQGSTTSSCDSNPSGLQGQVLQVRQSVSWPGMAGTKKVRAVTVLSPPVGFYSNTQGAIAVKVYDSTSSPAANVNVQVTGPTTMTQQTTTEGCAYFLPLDVGTYTASIIAGTGVGDQEDAVPTQSTSVLVGQTAPLTFQYDVPATIVATLPSPTNTPGAPPHATGMSISVANTGIHGYAMYTFPAATAGDTTTSPSLFPYASGYTVFAGNCTDNNPLGKDVSGNRFYPTAAPVPLDVAPGTSATAAVPLYSLAIHAQNSTAVPVTGTTPTVTETTFPSSPPPVYPTVCLSGTTSSSAPTLGLVTLTATGDSVTSVPLGHWTITARCTAPQAACPTTSKVGSINVWVKPDGVYAVDGTGVATTKFPGPITVVTS